MRSQLSISYVFPKAADGQQLNVLGLAKAVNVEHGDSKRLVSSNNLCLEV